MEDGVRAGRHRSLGSQADADSLLHPATNLCRLVRPKYLLSRDTSGVWFGDRQSRGPQDATPIVLTSSSITTYRSGLRISE